jgi:phosphosulfolactate synthase (CoM biosynthesis protein A)
MNKTELRNIMTYSSLPIDDDDRKEIEELKERIYEDRENGTDYVMAEESEVFIEGINKIAYKYENFSEDEE